MRLLNVFVPSHFGGSWCKHVNAVSGFLIENGAFRMISSVSNIVPKKLSTLFQIINGWFVVFCRFFLVNDKAMAESFSLTSKYFRMGRRVRIDVHDFRFGTASGRRQRHVSIFHVPINRGFAQWFQRLRIVLRKF